MCVSACVRVCVRAYMYLDYMLLGVFCRRFEIKTSGLFRRCSQKPGISGLKTVGESNDMYRITTYNHRHVNHILYT